MVRRNSLLSSLSCSAIIALAIASAGCHTPAERAAAPIAEKNAAARGGLEAWRAVKSMSMSGKLEAGRPRDQLKLAMSYLRPTGENKAEARMALARGGEAAPEKPVQLPFLMEMKRPGKKRLEVQFQGQTAVQVFDGDKGWKLRPFLGRREVEPYTAEEMRLTSQETELDGPLIDYAAKGNKVELVGTEQVEGREAHKLKVTLKNGQVRNVWVDAQTFLDVKIDGTRRMDGTPRTVWTYYRDYRAVDGLMIPHLLETTVENIKGSEKIMIELVSLNPELNDQLFAKPE